VIGRRVSPATTGAPQTVPAAHSVAVANARRRFLERAIAVLEIGVREFLAAH
jgi:hypothetical protein